MSWKYGEDLDKETIEKEEEELRNFVFDEISEHFKYSFKKCVVLF